MRYDKAVAEARQLVKRSKADQWRLAELTWEQLEAGKSRRQWAEDVGVSVRSVDAWRAVWARWGVQDLQTRPDWNVAYEQVNPTGARPETVDRAVRNMPPERKAEVVREALADPDVVRQVMDHPETRATVQRVERERVEERFDRGQIESSDTTERLDRAQADYAWLVALDRAAGALAEAQSLMARAPKTLDHREAGKKTLQHVATLAAGLLDVLASDLDAEWEALNR